MAEFDSLAVPLLHRGPGPSYAVNAKPHVGLTSAEPWRFDVTGREGQRWCATIPDTGVEGHLIDDDESLHCAVFCVFDDAEPDVRDGYAATGVSVDLVLDDDTRLSGLRLSGTDSADQYGIAVDARAQYDARLLSVDQWSSRTVPLDGLAGRTIVAVELSGWLPPRVGAAIDGAPRTAAGFVDSVRITRTPPIPREPIDAVRTTRGTFSSDRFSRGNCAPLVARPHGFVFGLPTTDGGNRSWPYSYHEASRVDGEQVRPYLQAFGTSHLPSPWMGDRGNFQVFCHPDPNVDPNRDSRALPFTRDGLTGELDRPDRYAVTLGDDAPIHAELTAGSHSIWLRATFTADTGASAGGSGLGALIFDQFDNDGHLELPEPTPGQPYVATGYVDGPGSGIKVPRAYVHVEVDAPVLAVRRFPGHPRERVLGAITVDTTASRRAGKGQGEVTVAVGVSHLSLEQAARNLAADRAGGGFDDVAAATRAEWSQTLGILQTEGATADQLTTLYSCLHRVALYPNLASENVASGTDEDWRYASVFDSGIERPDTSAETGRRITRGNLSVTDGFWDSYRASWPLRTLLAPTETARLAGGFVEHFRDGGWVSRWSAPGPADIMTGTSSDAVFADAALAGVWDRDEQTLLDAYDSCLRNATTPSDSRFVGRKGMDRSMFTGYAATDTHEGMSWTVDAAINDAAIASFSRYLAERLPEHRRAAEFAANADWFGARGARYALMFDSDSGFFRGREPGGAWRSGTFEPRNWGVDYTETTAWGSRFTAPHDGEGLARLYGGRAAMEAALDEFLALGETGRFEFKGGYPVVIHEQREARDTRMGMLALSNQPAHHIPFMYAYCSRPGSRAHAKTQAVVRDALQRLFTGSDLGQGYPGDEDNGELSAWYLLAASGLYPLSIGSGAYVLCSPLLPRLTWTLENGKKLDIVAPEASAENRYIQAVRVDGTPWTAITIDRARLAGGARIEFDLGPEPSDWAEGSVPPSLTAVGSDPRPPVDLTFPTGASATPYVFDDSSATPPEQLCAGNDVTWAFPEPTVVTHYTLTIAEPGVVAWQVRVRGTDGAWTTVATEQASYRWPHQTRVFALDPADAVTAVAVVATTELVVDQLELLDLNG